MAKNQIRFTDQHQADLTKILRSVGNRYGAWQVFRDFVAMGAIALSNAVDPRFRVAREAEYMSIVGRYSKEDACELARGFANVVMGLEAGMSDFLGSLYMGLDLGSAWSGQFFTPYTVSRLMADMTMQSAAETIKAKGFISVNDPAIGGGAMVIAAAHALLDQDINYQQQMHVTGKDIDECAIHMAYIQLSLLHIPAVLYHGNSLSMEVWSSWRTPAHVLGFWDSKLRRAAESDHLNQTEAAPQALPAREVAEFEIVTKSDASHGAPSPRSEVFATAAAHTRINLRDQISLF